MPVLLEKQHDQTQQQQNQSPGSQLQQIGPDAQPPNLLGALRDNDNGDFFPGQNPSCNNFSE
jgi:hypothetical protein